jgi:predicted transcriptional regulator
MLKITNNVGAERLVSRGAFEMIFKKQGWKVIKDKKAKVEEVVEVEDTDEEIEELLEKPTSKMTLEELKEYSDIMSIDIKGLSTKKEIREAIKSANLD